MSGASLNGVGTIAHQRLRSVVDSELGETFACSADAAIYKMATGTVKLNAMAGIGFRIRVAEGKFSKDDLILGLRGNDDLAIFEIDLADAIDVDGEPLKELSGEYQDIIVSLDDAKDSYYANKDGSESNVAVKDAMVGFHLYAKSTKEIGAIVEIEKVFAYDGGGGEVMLDTFNRTNVADASKTEAAAWWCGTTQGLIIRKGVTPDAESSYALPNITGEDYRNGDGASYGNLVLDMQGDASGLKLAGIPFADWKDPDGNPVVPIANGAYANYVVSFEKTGIADLTALTVTGDGKANIATVFLTDMEVPNLELTYPKLDTKNAKTIDNFNRKMNKAPTAWDGSIDPDDPNTAHLNGIVTYTPNATVTMDGHDLVLGATADYAQLTIGSKNAYAGARYIVFAIEDGADVSNFRFSFDAGQAIYLNSTFAKEGVPTIPDATIVESPYDDEIPGYDWYIVDTTLIKDFSQDTSGAFNLYYTGETDLKIDAIFFAEEDAPKAITKEGEIALTEAPLATYQYVGGMDLTGNEAYLGLEIQGDGVATFDSLRVEYGGSTKWVKDGEIVATVGGAPIRPGTLIPTEKAILWIDLAASGYALEAGAAHCHIGDGYDGSVTITRILSAEKSFVVKAFEDLAAKEIAPNAYTYLCGFDLRYAGPKTLTITVKGDGQVATMANFRLEMTGGKTLWLTHEGEEHLPATLLDGTPYDATAAVPSEGVTIRIDLSAFGTEIAPGAFHMHISGEGFAANGTIAIENANWGYEATPYGAVIDQYA